MFIGNKFLNEQINLPYNLFVNRRQILGKKRSVKKHEIVRTQPNQNIAPKYQQLKIGQDLLKVKQQRKERGKLPMIRVKSLYSINTIYKKYLADLQNKSINTYLQKYIKFKSQQKKKQDEDSGFLSIASLKPFKRKNNKITQKECRLKILPRTIKEDIQLSNPLNAKCQQQRSSSQTKQTYKTSKKQLLQTYKTSKKQLLNETSHQKHNIILKNVQQRQQKNALKIMRREGSNDYNQYEEWCMFLAIIDGISILKSNTQTYKAYIGKGNNSNLIKSALKTRYWWMLSSHQSDANLYWTQSRKKKYLQNLRQNSKQQIQYLTTKIKLHNIVQMPIYLSDKIETHVKWGYHKLLANNQQQMLFTSSSLQINQPRISKYLHASKEKMHNHLEFNWNLCNKKGLYYNLMAFYKAIGKNPFQFIPETYHVQTVGDDQWINFINSYEQKKSFWIIKPGENSNRGCGIDVAETLQQIKEIIKNKSILLNGKKRSHIIQRYIMPLLYNKRKFDIRCYMLVTTLNGNLRCYWYEEGYIRTSSKEFTVKNLKNRMIHLTNDAIQKHSQDYGKHESGNKLSFNEIDKYIKNNYPNWNFYETIYPKMMRSAENAIKSVSSTIDSRHREHSFEIFGLDFMIDQNFDAWLIQINTNPCLQLSCPLLARLIPEMIQNSLRIAVDPIFPPPKVTKKQRGKYQYLMESNRYTLIYSARQSSVNSYKSTSLLNLMQNQQLNDSFSQDQQ